MKKNPEINQFNLNSGVFSMHKSSIYNTKTWHKIEVENAASFTRNKFLRIMMNFVHPLDFIPVCFEINNGIVSFLLKNCGAAIEKICKQNLIVPNPEDPNLPFKLKIILNFASAADLKIAIQPNIKAILNTKRFNFTTGLLDLDNFSQEPDLIEFCTLSQPKQMFYILHLSRNLPIKTLKLTNNEIEVLKPIEALFGIKSITHLDLRNNKLTSGELANLEGLYITDLLLDGNPLCDEFDEVSYQKACKQACPNLEILDGCTLPKNGLLNCRKNFLCTPSGHDLVDQFLEHYFTLYDAMDRSILEALYHKDAMFSMTSTYLALQSTSLSAKLGHYKKISRNIKMMSDFSKNYEHLYRGPANIMRVFRSLPPTEHDPYSFSVDLMSYTEKTAVLSVTGVFREIADSLLESDRILGFCRIFVLMQGLNMEYHIINEQVNITNATTLQAARAFKLYKGGRVPMRQIQIPKPQGAKDQLDMAEAVKAMTGLNTEWSIKFLEECNYDLAKTLTFFVDVFKLDKLPEEAFREGDIPKVKTPQESQFQPVSAPVTQITRQEFTPLNKIPVTTRPHENPKNAANYMGNQNRNFQVDVNRTRVIDVLERQNKLKKNAEKLDKPNPDSSSANEIVDSKVKSDSGKDKPTTVARLPLPPLESYVDSSPHGIFEEYEPFAYVNIFKAKKITKEKYLGNADIWKTVESLATLKSDFMNMKSLHGNNFKETFAKYMEAAMGIVSKYCYHIVTYQLLLLWFYPRHTPTARDFVTRVRIYIQANQAKCISKRAFDVCVAECECVYGNIKMGESVFQCLRQTFPEYLPTYVAYMRCLISKNRLKEASTFISQALNNPKVDAQKLKGLVQTYQQVLYTASLL